MKDLYQHVGIAKQTHMDSVTRHHEEEDKFLMLCALLNAERELHPAMSLKKLYVKLNPDFVGRDAFIDFCMDNGYESIRIGRFSHKTTTSGEQGAVPNLLYDMTIYGINCVWASDITYFKIAGVWHYIALIIDIYSRRILGYNASTTMHTESNMIALRMALSNRGIADYAQKLIHQSDKGTQYRSNEYKALLQENGIRPSMGNCCYDNAHMESANGILKNEYLKHKPIHSLADLKRYLKQVVALYNAERPHGSLPNMMTPVQFESYLSNMPLQKRVGLRLFADKKYQHKMLPIKPDNQQLRFQF
jgi:transposase InsO family protein